MEITSIAGSRRTQQRFRLEREDLGLPEGTNLAWASRRGRKVEAGDESERKISSREVTGTEPLNLASQHLGSS